MVVIVITVIVVSHACDSEEHAEPVDHVSDHRSFKLLEEKEEQ